MDNSFLKELIKDLQINHDSQCKELDRTEYWDKCKQCKLEQRLMVYERIISLVSKHIRIRNIDDIYNI